MFIWFKTYFLYLMMGILFNLAKREKKLLFFIRHVFDETPEKRQKVKNNY